MSDVFLDHDLLVAYVDGELPRERLAAVEAALMRDAEAWETVRLLRLSANAAARAFAPVLQEPIPARLMEAANPARANSRRPARFWPMALAASLAALAIGVGAGYELRSLPSGYIPASLTSADPLAGKFEAALQTILEKGKPGESLTYESPAAGSGQVVLGPAFATGFGAPCQEFHRDETRGSEHRVADGIACRAADKSWSVMILPRAE
jgi:surface antigen